MGTTKSGGPPNPHGMILKIPLVGLARSSSRGHRICLTTHLLKVYFSKFLILSTGLPQRRSPGEIDARRGSRLPIQNRTHILTVSFLSALIFGLIRKPRNIYKHV